MRALPSLLILLLLPGCATPTGTEPASPAHGAAHADVATVESLFPDVHGLAYDAPTATLWVATHTGLQRRVGAGAFERVGPAQDLMGFSRDPASGETFWASGHPATGGNLGAIRSVDGGATWTPVGAAGMDFHAMTATPDALYGFFRGAVHRSTDGGATWEPVSMMPVAAFAHDAGTSTLYAATTTEVRASDDRGETWRTLATLPAYGLAAAGNGTLYAAVKNSGVQKSVDGGATWSATSLDAGTRFVGHVAVARGSVDIVHAASYDGAVWRSDDAGATWRPVR